MPNADEWCEVRTTQGIFRDWTSVSVHYAFEENWLRTFVLELAEVGKRSKTMDSLLKLKSGDRVDIALASHVVIQEGYIKTRQAAYDAQRHAVQISGYSKAGPTTEVSTEVKQYQDQSLEQIANDALKQHGVKFKMGDAPSGASDPFKNVVVHPGESAFSLIERLARQRNCWLSVEKDGTIVAGGSKGSGGKTVLEEGRNIVAATCSIEKIGVDEIISRSQTPGSDSLFGKKAAQISAKSKIADGGSGKLIVLSSHANTQKELQQSTDMEAAALLSEALRVMVTHRGWFKPGTKALWELKDEATIKSPMLFPIAKGELDLTCWAVTYQQSNDAGTSTSVEFVSPGVFSQKAPDAREPSSFYPSAEKAEPESA